MGKVGQRVGHGEPLFALCKHNVEIMWQLSLPRASHHCRWYKRRGQKVSCHCVCCHSVWVVLVEKDWLL